MAEPALIATRRIIDHRHQAALIAARFIPAVEAAIQLHQLAEMGLALATLAIRRPMALHKNIKELRFDSDNGVWRFALNVNAGPSNVVVTRIMAESV